MRNDFKKFKKINLFSDAFFPFIDSLLLIKRQNIKIDTYAPMGSKNDLEIKNIKKIN